MTAWGGKAAEGAVEGGAYTVSQVNRYIKSMFAGDGTLSDIRVAGELSNFKRHHTGHMYFSVKDEGSVISCVMFRDRAETVAFLPENGHMVVVRGAVSVFERDGRYQIYCASMAAAGRGALDKAFEELKLRLSGEGLFDAGRKRRIPMLPESVGVVTSPTGSVLRDIVNVIDRRFPGMRVKVLPVAVQGVEAPKEVAKAIAQASRFGLCDVLIVARGGGSAEELWAFNAEEVARACAASVIPVISAVGHETDFTILDFVADVRAPTPSAAAELAVPEKGALKALVDDYRRRLADGLSNWLAIRRAALGRFSVEGAYRGLTDMIGKGRLRASLLGERLCAKAQESVRSKRAELEALLKAMGTFDVPKALDAGYAVVTDLDGRLVRTVGEVRAGGGFVLRMRDGSQRCRPDFGDAEGPGGRAD